MDDEQPDTGRTLAVGVASLALGVNRTMVGAPSVGPPQDGVSCITNGSPRDYNNLDDNQALCALL